MHILVSNDDGYNAPGIHALSGMLSELAEVTIVAPDTNRSASSNSLTIYNPLRVYGKNGIYYVNGTPADCVHLAITGFLDTEPDMVVSGINNGPNLGEDVLYSGTVGAAMEGRHLGLPAIAISICALEPQYFTTAAKVAYDLVSKLKNKPMQTGCIFNVNVPDIPYEELNGFMVTRCGKRARPEPVIESHDARGRKLYWVGRPGPQTEAGEGTDFYAVENNYVSVTPLKAELTDQDNIENVREWLV